MSHQEHLLTGSVAFERGVVWGVKARGYGKTRQGYLDAPRYRSLRSRTRAPRGLRRTLQSNATIYTPPI